jgi:hypothetical protein
LSSLLDSSNRRQYLIPDLELHQYQLNIYIHLHQTMYLQLYLPKREHLFPQLFESSEMQQILGSENTKRLTVGRQRRQSEGVYVKGKIHGIQMYMVHLLLILEPQ